MTGESKRVRVAATGDLHVHATSRGQLRDLLAEVAERAEVLALCGDLTNLGLTEEAEALAAELSDLRIPVVAVLGNHDHHHGQPQEVRKVLRQAKVNFLEEDTFEVGGLGFAGVKGFGGGFGSRMLASFGEDAIKRFVAEAVGECLALETALVSLQTERRAVVLHYAPVPETTRGEPPEILPFVGSSRLAETIDRFEVSAVFHGHAHHGSPSGQTPRGVPVYNCSMDLLRRTDGQLYVLVEL